MNDTDVAGCRRLLLWALACFACAIGWMLVLGAPARASTYGGLGAVGHALKSGEAGGSGELGPYVTRGFAVDQKTGDIFLADTYLEAETETLYAHIQELSPSGTVLGEAKLKLTKPEVGKTPAEEELLAGERVSVGGLAVDPNASGGERLYLLLVRERPEDEEEKGFVIRNPEAPAAAAVYAFSTTPSKTGKLATPTLLASEEKLATEGEGKAPLLFPSGIAVDPATHDVMISGRQNESTETEGVELEESEEEEFERTGVQRIHEGGGLGPRYLDSEDCFYAEPVHAEPACEEDEEGFAGSPIVTAGGRVLLTLWGEEIWEMPTPESSPSEGFKEVGVVPRHLYTLGSFEETFPRVLEGEPSESGATTSYVANGPKEGTIDIEGNHEGNKAVARLLYSESGATPTVQERGWTGGQPTGSAQQGCALGGYGLPLAGAGEDIFVLDVQEASAAVMEFGPGGEACGSEPTLSAPSVSLGEKTGLTEVPIGSTATLSSTIATARAMSEVWSISRREGKGAWHHEATITTSYSPSLETDLEYDFAGAGEYEVSEKARTDDLSYPEVSAAPTFVTTVAVAPAASTLGASALSASSEQLNGSVEPRGFALAACAFEYGTSPLLGSSIACASTPSAPSGSQPVSAVLGGLQTGTTYYYRLAATGPGGSADGATMSFQTAPAPPSTPGPSTPHGGSEPASSVLSSQTSTPLAAPEISAFGESHASWRLGSALASISKASKAPVGTGFSFALNEAARASLSFESKLTGRKVSGKCVAQSRRNARKKACTRLLPRGQLSFAAHSGLNKIAFDGRLSAGVRLAPGSYELALTVVNAAGASASAKSLSFTIVK